MAKHRILVQWIGHSDLRALAASLSQPRREKILSVIKGDAAREGDLGPTRTLLSGQHFDEVHLLSTYDSEWNTWFQDWLELRTELVEVKLERPTDYSRIFEIADSHLKRIRESNDHEKTELCLHLSPGTPAMAAIWLLLGKTRYPATFYETWNGSWWITDVPFALVDMIPDVLRHADAYLQHLASEVPGQIAGFEDIVGNSRAIRDAVGRSRRAAIRGISVLLLGESGTGKEMFARAIHKASPRRDKPFRAINCAAISPTLLESELFGHAKGAFTGAEKERKGAFEAADGGTLFLDEVGECDLGTQAKLLRVLQPVSGQGAAIRKVTRLGEDQERTVDVRIVAATNRDLQRGIAERTFREDLYYRLAAVTITLPALRERRSDISLLAEHLLNTINRQFSMEEPGFEHKSFSASAIAFVKARTWPGNVRQLYNTLVQAAVFTDGNRIGRADLAAALGEVPSPGQLDGSLADQPLGDGFDLEEFLNSIQKRYLQRAMQEARGVKAQAARLLGMKNYQTLDAQLKRLDVRGQWSDDT
jgi:DNA-binding NtrC family response regulator